MSAERKLKILIVDDDAFILNMYVAKFATSGHEVITARGATEALSKLKDEVPPDVVLLDVVLPGTDGLELLARIRQENLVPQAKYIMLTNQSDTEEMERARALGVSGFITKAAMTPSEIVQKVLELAETSQKS